MPRRVAVPALALIVVGAAIRLSIALASLHHAATWEESWSATAAKLLAAGDPGFLLEGPYAPWTWVSGIEGVLGAPLVAVFGESVFVWKLLPVGLFAAVSWLFFAVVRRFAGDRAALVALGLFTLGPPSLLHWSLFTTHGRVVAWAGPLLFLLALATALEDPRRATFARLFGAGFLGGLSFTLHWDNAVPVGIATGIYLAILALGEPAVRNGTFRAAAALAAGSAIGAAPSIVLLLARGHPLGIYNESFAVEGAGFATSLAGVPAAIANSFVFWGAGEASGRVLGWAFLAALAALATGGAVAVGSGVPSKPVAAGPVVAGAGAPAVEFSERERAARRMRRFAIAFLGLELIVFPILFAASGFGRTRYFRSIFPALLAAGGVGAAAMLARGGLARASGALGLAAALAIQTIGASQFFDRSSFGESLRYAYSDWREGRAQTLWKFGRSASPTDPALVVSPEVSAAVRSVVETGDPRSLAAMRSVLQEKETPEREAALRDLGFRLGDAIVREGAAAARAESTLLEIAKAGSVAAPLLSAAGWSLGKAWLAGRDPEDTLLRIRSALGGDGRAAFVSGFLESSWEPDAKIPWRRLGEDERSHWFRRQRIESIGAGDRSESIEPSGPIEPLGPTTSSS